MWYYEFLRTDFYFYLQFKFVLQLYIGIAEKVGHITVTRPVT